MKPGNKIWHYCLLAFALLLILQSGCNPAKQVAKQAKQYQQLVDDYNTNHPPIIDTSFVYIKGKADSFYIPVPVTDPAAIQRIKDSIQDRYKGVAAGCSADINNAFDAGYQQARIEIKKQKLPAGKTDTIIRTITPVRYINTLKNTISNQAADLQACNQKKSYLWYFIASLFVIALLICLLLKKR